MLCVQVCLLCDGSSGGRRAKRGGSILQLQLQKCLGWCSMGKKSCPVFCSILSVKGQTPVHTSASRAEVSAEVRASNHGLEKCGVVLVAVLV